MQRVITFCLSAVLMLITQTGMRPAERPFWMDMSLTQVLHKLGEPLPAHYMEPTAAEVALGRQLVYEGRSTATDAKPTAYISKYFMCTSCHNSIQEDPDIRFADPDARLPYLAEKGAPFLQGSTFWGIVNRESWYNDDYYLKYGDNVKAANNSLRKAIQLCAIECSQGRPLDMWEENAILAYYWSLELHMRDIVLPVAVQEELSASLRAGKHNPGLVQQIKAWYPTTSPATFRKPLHDKRKGYEAQGDPGTGRLVYEQSCRHCHGEGGVSDFLLDEAPHTFRFLQKNLYKDNDFSLYNIIGKGTYASPGARPYMPHYPKEKMSDRQIESLRLYIEQGAM